MNSVTRVHLNRVWRRKWLVLILTIGALALGFFSTRDAAPTYTSRIAMTIGSPNRAPDQDAVLSVGYAQYFKDPAYQTKLKAAAGIPDGTILDARTVASSPILYIEGTASTPGLAQAGATKAGSVFRDEINASLRAGQDAAIAAVRKPFDDIRAANGVVSDASLTQMQEQINRLNADTSNKLIDLQQASDPVREEPSRIPTLVSYGVGGLLLGCLAALAVGALSRRLRTGEDVEEKVGLTAIAVVPGTDGKLTAERDRAFKQVVTAVGLAAPVEKASVAITAPGSSDGIEILARAIADERARQGVRTILVHADLSRRLARGVGEVLAGRADLDAVLTPTRLSVMRELFPGSIEEEPFTVLSRERFTRLLSRLHERADFVVFIGPPVLSAVEAQVVAATAGTTVLVLDPATTTVEQARRAHRLLAAVDANLLGAVLLETPQAPAAGGHAPPGPEALGDRRITAARAAE
ncbi:Wzz/FepE/Etk N-terminal domain-containing protein [Nocardia jejuensis]|uniref:Wzz/FepE/Etk N-terminal domain-containing protein n=1 Tax=Nocardia jejuensis TaxID=328049 RepID=UPI0012F907A6|nr:Wzz/FepE/Etk N-terminal domain-containing protein [Nocardia jejuensis]